MKDLQSNTDGILNLTYSFEATQTSERYLKELHIVTLVPLAERVCGQAFKWVTARSSLLF